VRRLITEEDRIQEHAPSLSGGGASPASGEAGPEPRSATEETPLPPRAHGCS
jgi:hypothetical protein